MTTDAGQVTDGDITIDSNHETVDQIQSAFADDPPAADSEASAPIAVAPVEKPTEKRRNRSDSASEAVSSAVGKQRAA